MTHPQLSEILARLKSELHRRYNDRLVEIRLFGSQARGDATKESDIDLLVVLKGKVNTLKEQNYFLEFRYDLELEFQTLIQVLFISEQEFEKGAYYLFQKIEEEGTVI